MKRLTLIAALTAVAIGTSACVIIDVDADDFAWSGENAQPFDAARDGCRATAGSDQSSDAFRACMAEKGWTRHHNH